MSDAFNLDTVLSKPLAEIPDGGFSHALTLRLIELRARRARLTTMIVAVVVALICLAMPFTEFGQAANRWVLDFVQQMSTPLEVAAGALVVCGLILQLYSDAIGPRATSKH